MAMQAILDELKAALAEHDGAWKETRHLPLAGITGPVRTANERIECAREAADCAIREAGVWPDGQLAIGNAKAVAILEELL